MTERTRGAPKNNSLVSSAVKAIEALIAEGRLVPGQRLIEADLAEELNLGRVPIREALRILAGDGSVELIPNRGARIRPITNLQIAEMLETQGALLYFSIEAFTSSPSYADSMQKLEDVTKTIARKSEERDSFALLELATLYQRIVFEATENVYMIDFHNRLRFAPYFRQLINALGGDVVAGSTDFYVEVTAALRAGESQRASEMYRSHVQATVARLRQLDDGNRASA